MNPVSGWNQYFPVSWILCQHHYQTSLKLLKVAYKYSISVSMYLQQIFTIESRVEAWL